MRLFWWWPFWSTWRLFMVCPLHICVPSGTYYNNDEDLIWSEETGTDKRPILATNHLLLICQCHYVGHLRRNSKSKNPNSKHDFGGCFYLSWWTWQPAQMMRRASPTTTRSGLYSKPLDAAFGWVLAPYQPGGAGGCHGHRFCCAMMPKATKHNF